MKEILYDPQFTYIKGNHDDLLVKTFTTPVAHNTMVDGKKLNRDQVKAVWFSNGGLYTYTELQKCKDKEKIITDLAVTPMKIELDNKQGQHVVLTHAGFTPSLEPARTHQLWHRNHIREEWPTHSSYSNTIIVHGHTPIPFLLEAIDPYETILYDSADGSIWYAEGHKVCVDTGAVFTGWTVLLNLDTWDQIVIEGAHCYDI